MRECNWQRPVWAATLTPRPRLPSRRSPGRGLSGGARRGSLGLQGRSHGPAVTRPGCRRERPLHRGFQVARLEMGGLGAGWP